jgi:hypothetical protein
VTARERPGAGEARRYVDGGFATQEQALAFGRAARLTSRAPGDEQPALVVLESDGGVRFAKEHPTAGMLPPAMHLALSAHELGGPILFAFDAPARTAIARIWDDEGHPFADLELLDLDACGALSAAYWPKRGYLVVASRASSARAQLLRESGTLAFDRGGVDVAGAWRAPAPVTIAFDAPDSAMLIQHATVGARDHVLVWRYDAKLRALWREPVDLGEVPRVKDVAERIQARPVRDGAIRVELARGLVGSRARAAIVDSSGAVTRE